MLPWPPKMATGQKLVNKAVDAFISCWGGTWEGFSLITPLKPPPAPRPEALAHGPPASEPSASGPPSPGPPTRGRTSSSWWHKRETG